MARDLYWLSLYCVLVGIFLYIKIYGWKRLKVEKSIIWGASRGYRTRLVLLKSPRTSQHTYYAYRHWVYYTATRHIYIYFVCLSVVKCPMLYLACRVHVVVVRMRITETTKCLASVTFNVDLLPPESRKFIYFLIKIWKYEVHTVKVMGRC